jgi:hypothetical protein
MDSIRLEITSAGSNEDLPSKLNGIVITYDGMFPTCCTSEHS